MDLHYIDWIVIGIYGVIIIGIGLWYSKKAGEGLEEYFVAGRSLPWWIAGTSIAATYFATDAPLAAASLVRQYGIFGNWLWWYEASGVMMIVFFYAKLWRRANIITDAEFIELRYSGKAASILRAFTATYHGLLKNLIVMGFVLLAMMKFSQVILGFDPLYTLGICVTVALLYTMTSGLFGVVYTDLFQFITGTVGTIIFAGLVLYEVGGPAAMVEQIKSLEDVGPGTLDIIPQSEHMSSLQFISYVVLIFILWTRSAQGDGYLVQRLFAAKNEKHSVLAALWFNFATNVLMTWPWIIVGLGSLIIFPLATASPELLADPELAYPMMITEVVPIGIKGLIIASFLSAFMSTMDTHLCWGASYMVNDIYKRFINKTASEKHYVKASRWAILILAVFAAITAWQMDSIERGWLFIIQLTAGIALVMLLRWYWWRVNPWAEISAMIASFILANGPFWAAILEKIGVFSQEVQDEINVVFSSEYDMLRATFILVASTVIWITVTLLTRPDDKKHLQNFYRKVRPGGWWGDIAKSCPDVVIENTATSKWIGWFIGVLFIYSSLLGFGYLIIDQNTLGLGLLIVAVIGAILTIMLAKKSFREV
ncbi:sodium:solute symporter family protein [Flagellimonas sp.]|uniref:sodium:solute symporter family protein n=1 Tax=Flagellimonas sp. TaxID=2058762 RepID=UPI003BACCF03